MACSLRIHNLPRYIKIKFKATYSRPISYTKKLFDDPLDNDDIDSIASTFKSLVSQFGEAVPKPSSCLILPVTRRPVFPNFASTVLVKDKVIAKRILENERGNYIGLFLRKDKGLGVEDTDIITNINQIYTVGTFARIQNAIATEMGAQLLLAGHRRINLTNITDMGPPMIGDITHWKKMEEEENSQVVKAYINEVVLGIRELITMNPLAHEHIQNAISRYDLSDPYKLADFAAAITTADGAELQKVLECEELEPRLVLALTLLSKEIELAKLQKEIKKQVEEKISENQRKYFLQEQYKSIRNELGLDKDDKEELLEKYQEKVTAIKSRLHIPSTSTTTTTESPSTKITTDTTTTNGTGHTTTSAPSSSSTTTSQSSTTSLPTIHPDVLKVIESEMKKLSTLEKNSPEFNVTRTYLDWLTAIPWGLYTKDRLNIQQAKIVLDHDHYGLEEVKKRILEFIAIGKLKKSVKGKIICLIGPPGVGKTSIAKSIASALNRKFYRFSVGGLTDIAEIKGHRRTYIGAMPGKPIQSLKMIGYANPLILIDEIDKLGRGGYNGDPASALLELLDPNQNESFVDHFLDVPVDFSDVLFVCTANDESTIPGPLKDRMEVIRLSGYDIPEKVAIATRYLVPKALKEAGFLDDTQVKVNITETALEDLVKSYCRESGVRSLEKHIEKIVRKIAFDIAIESESGKDTTSEIPVVVTTTSEEVTSSDNIIMIPSTSATIHSSSEEGEYIDLNSIKKEITVNSNELEKYVGKPKFTQDTIYDSKTGGLPVGIVMGLAWNPLGGSPIFIETAAIPSALNESGGGVNMVTGQLGSVMKESVNIAYTYARKFIAAKQPENLFFKSHQIHLHVPEGAVEKDGPSAGIAMTSSIVSLATNQPLRSHIAMTGEISLTGKVLPVGGIKEKVLAARRAGANTVILPHTNRRDFDELPSYVKESITVHFVSDYEEVYNIIFEH